MCFKSYFVLIVLVILNDYVRRLIQMYTYKTLEHLYTPIHCVCVLRYQVYSSSLCSKERISEHGLVQHDYEIDVVDTPPEQEKVMSKESICCS